MDKRVTVLHSFEDADRADKAFYRSLTPCQRLEILLELNARWPVGADAESYRRLARVYHITEFA
jgi:hypothetical protein